MDLSTIKVPGLFRTFSIYAALFTAAFFNGTLSAGTFQADSSTTPVTKPQAGQEPPLQIEADSFQYAHHIASAHSAIKRRDFSLARRYLDRCQGQLREWEWRYLNGLINSELFSIPGFGEFSPDGNLIASKKGAKIEIYDAWTGNKVNQFDAKKGFHFMKSTFKDDQNILLISSNESKLEILICDVRTGKTKTESSMACGYVSLSELELSRDKSSLGIPRTLSSAGKKTNRQFDVIEGKVIDIATGKTKFDLPFSDKHFQLGPKGNKAIRSFIWGDKKPSHIVKADGESIRLEYPWINYASFSADGNHLLALDNKGRLLVFDANTGRISFEKEIEKQRGFDWPIFVGNSKLIARPNTDIWSDFYGLPFCELRVFDFQTGNAVFHERRIETFIDQSPLYEFSGNGKYVAYVTQELPNTLTIRALSSKTRYHLTEPWRISWFKWSPDSQRVVVGNQISNVVVRDLATLREHGIAAPAVSYPNSEISPDGLRLILRGSDRTRVYSTRGENDLDNLKPADFLAPNLSAYASVSNSIVTFYKERSSFGNGWQKHWSVKLEETDGIRFDPTGSKCMVGQHLCDLNTKKIIAQLPKSEVAFSHDGKWAANFRDFSRSDSIFGSKPSIGIFDTATGEPKSSLEFDLEGAFYCEIGLSFDGALAFVLRFHRTGNDLEQYTTLKSFRMDVLVFDTKHGKHLHTKSIENFCFESAKFGPDGKSIWALMPKDFKGFFEYQGRLVRIDLESGEQTNIGPELHEFSFTKTGRRIIGLGSRGRHLHVFDGRSGVELLTIENRSLVQEWGSELYISDDDQHVIIWEHEEFDIEMDFPSLGVDEEETQKTPTPIMYFSAPKNVDQWRSDRLKSLRESSSTKKSPTEK